MNEWVAPIVVALIAALPGLFALRGQFKRDDANVAQTYSNLLNSELVKRRETAQRIDELTTKVRELNDRVATLETELKRKEKIIQRLSAELAARKARE